LSFQDQWVAATKHNRLFDSKLEIYTLFIIKYKVCINNIPFFRQFCKL
jgi:hypothetical protein